MNLIDALKKAHRHLSFLLEPKITIEDYYVPESLKRELDGVAFFNHRTHCRFWRKWVTEIFFSLVPKGTGKTLGAQYLASTIGGLIYDGKLVNNADAIRMAFAQLREVAKEQEKPIFLLSMKSINSPAGEQSLIQPSEATLNALLDETQDLTKMKYLSYWNNQSC